MKALIKEAGVVQLVDVPQPEVRRPDDVVIRVLVAGICRTDLYVASGAIPSADPITLGHEFAGRVIACGAQAAFAVGDLVTADPRVGDAFLGVDRHGAFAEYVAVPAANVYRLPTALDPRAAAYIEPVAAALAAPHLVQQEGLAREARVEGWRGIVCGPSRFARLVHEVVRLEGCDAELVLDHEPRSREFDFAIETGGTTAELAFLIDALEPGGLLVLKSRRPGKIEIPVHEVVVKGISIRARQYGAFQRAVDMISGGELDVSRLLGETFSLAHHREAFTRASSPDESQKHFLSCAG